VVTCVHYRVQSRLGISCSLEVVNGLGVSFWIDPVGITVWGETDQRMVRQRREGRSLHANVMGILSAATRPTSGILA